MARWRPIARLESSWRGRQRQAKVEAGIRFAQIRALGQLRAQAIFSRMQRPIALVMQRVNERSMRDLSLGRQELFAKIERAALNNLPAEDRGSRNGGARGST
jgi:hypothetical protein